MMIYITHQEGTPETTLGIGRTNNIKRRYKEHNGSKQVLEINFIHKFDPSMYGKTDDVAERDLHIFFKDKRDPKQKEIFHNITLEEIEVVKNQWKYGVARPKSYSMRPEQQACHDQFTGYLADRKHKACFMDAKMRFGKIFTSLEIAKTMGYKTILCITFRPAVSDSWEKDIAEHVNYEGWEYTDLRTTKDIPETDYPNFIFGSIQGTGNVNNDDDETWQFIKDLKVDLLIIDEFHEGTDTDRSKKLLKTLQVNKILWLSGTALRAKQQDKFSPEATYSWTYLDEQRAKKNWIGEDNPYLSLPQIQIHMFETASAIKGDMNKLVEVDITLKNLFDLSVDGTEFAHRAQVRNFLKTISDSKHAKMNPFEIADIPHSVWFLPKRVEVIRQLKKEMESMEDFNDYHIVLATSSEVNDVTSLNREMNTHDKTITLSIGVFTTGVSVPKWSAVFMMHDGESEMEYLQSIFRGQTPNEGKDTTYVFDFSPARVLETVMRLADNAKTGTSKKDEKQRIKDLITYLPIYSYDNSTFKGVLLDESALAQEYYLRGDITKSFNVILGTEFNIRTLPDDLRQAFKNMEADVKVKPKKAATSKGTSSSSTPSTTTPKPKDTTKEDEKVIENIKKFIKYLPRFIFLTPGIKCAEDLLKFSKADPVLFKELTSQTPDILSKVLIVGEDDEDGGFITEEKMDTAVARFNARVEHIVHRTEDKDYATKMENAMQLLQYFPRHLSIEESTPWNLVVEMVNNTMTDEFLSNKDLVILEPVVGNGTFVYALFIRMFRLPYWVEEFPDGLDRADAILNTIHFNDIQRRYILTIKKILELVFGEYYDVVTLHDNVKNFLTESILDMKPDIIIGNPPYQENDGGQGASAKAIYHHFIEKGLELADTVIMVTPSRWMAGGKGLTKFRKKVTDGKLKISKIKHFEEQLFGGAEIRGGISYCVWDNNHVGKTDFNGDEIELDRYDAVFQTGHDLVDRLMKYDKLSDIMFGSNTSGIRANGVLKGETSKDLCRWSNTKNSGDIRIRVTKTLGEWKWINPKLLKDDYPLNSWKVLIPDAIGEQGLKAGRKVTADAGEASTETFIGFYLDTEEERDSMLSYINTSLVNFLHFLRQAGIHNKPDTYAFVPQVPLDRMWDDTKVEKYFGITEDEKKLWS